LIDSFAGYYEVTSGSARLCLERKWGSCARYDPINF